MRDYIDVRLTAIVRIRRDGWKHLPVQENWGDVSLAVAQIVLPDLPDGLEYMDRTAQIALVTT